MPGEQIDRSAITKVVVRDLGHDFPAARAQKIGGRTHDGRVPLIEQAIDGAASPSDLQIDTRFEAPEDLPNRSDLDCVEMSAFQHRELLLADADQCAELLLRQPRTAAERPKQATRPDVVHR